MAFQQTRVTPQDMPRAGDVINGVFEPGMLIYGCPVGSDTWVKWWLNKKVVELAETKEKACKILRDDKQALFSLLSLSFSKRLDYHSALVYPSNFAPAAEKFDGIVWSYLEAATGLSIPTGVSDGDNVFSLDLPVNSLNTLSFQQHLARLPISKGGLGIRSLSQTSNPAFFGGIVLSLPSFTGPLGIVPALESVIGRPDRKDIERWTGLLQGNSRTGQEFSDSWIK